MPAERGTVAQQAPANRGPANRGIVTALLFAAAIINYVDRGSLSVAAPIFSRELALTPVALGLLLSAFFWTYAGSQLVAGWLVDRFAVGRVFAGGFAIWSLATLATGLAHGFASLFAARLLLGIGEAVAFPCFSKIIVASFAPGARGLPNAVIEAGTKIGPALGVLIGGLLAAAFGWRAMFFALGMLSLVWLVPWKVWGPRLDHAAGASGVPSPGFARILRSRDAWGTFIGCACYLYAFFFLLTWLPKYLVDVRGLSMVQLGTLGAIPFLFAAITAVATGWLSDRLIARGASPTLVRKSVVATGLLLSMAALPAAIVPQIWQSIALLTLAYGAFGIFASNLWAISQTLAGPAAGKWAGLQNAIGALAGVVAPIVTGFVVQTTHSYTIAFVLAAALQVVGAGAYVFIVGPIAPVKWEEPVSP